MEKYPSTELLLSILGLDINHNTNNFSEFWHSIKTNPYHRMHLPPFDSTKIELEEVMKSENFDWVEVLERLKVLDPFYIYDADQNLKLQSDELFDYFRYWYWDYYFPEKAYSELSKERMRRYIIKYMTRLPHIENEWIPADDVFKMLKATRWPRLEYFTFQGLFEWNESALRPEFIIEKYRMPNKPYSRLTELKLVNTPVETHKWLRYYFVKKIMPYALLPVERYFIAFMKED